MNTQERLVPVLEADHVCRHFYRGGRFPGQGIRFAAVNDVSFQLHKGELLGLLGESGCGKTTLARMLMHLLRPDSGTISINGTPVQDMPERRFRKMRRTIQMVYQNPFDCLDPSAKISAQLDEPMKLWYPQKTSAERAEAIYGMLQECGLPENCLSKRPAEFSGGQLQRISIARALLANPEILIADEIISALDVPIQNQILQLLFRMKQKQHLSILFITHDLAVARKVSDRVMVMQEGKIKGIGAPEEIFRHHSDPYIRALREAVFIFSSRQQDDL